MKSDMSAPDRLKQFFRINTRIDQLLDRRDNCRFVLFVGHTKPFILCLKDADCTFSVMNTAVDHRWEKVFRFQIPLFHAGEEFRESFFQFFYERCRQYSWKRAGLLLR